MIGDKGKCCSRHDRCRLPRALHRAAIDRLYRSVREPFAGCLRLLNTGIAEIESGHASVQDIGRIMHLPMPHEVKRCSQLNLPLFFSRDLK